MSTLFADWLYQELDMHGWTQAELARRSGITPAALSRILSGGRNPGVEVVRGIARALKIPTEEVMRRAGILPMQTEAGENDRQVMQEIVRQMERLRVEDRQYAAEFIKRSLPDV